MRSNNISGLFDYNVLGEYNVRRYNNLINTLCVKRLAYGMLVAFWQSSNNNISNNKNKNKQQKSSSPQ